MKIAVIPMDILTLTQPIAFKKISLLFRGIAIDAQSITLAKRTADQLPPNWREAMEVNFKEIDYLAGLGIIQAFESSSLREHYKKALINGKELFAQAFFEELPSSLISFKVSDLGNQARILANELRELGNDAVPLYCDLFHFEQNLSNEVATKKESVLHMVFSNMPEPDEHEPWEKILDFRNDPATLKKYYDLINWVNEISKADLTTSEIREKFMQLYYDYLEQYRMHKVQFNLSVFETLLTISLEALTGKFDTLKSSISMISIKQKSIALIDSEAKLSGKEIAFIHRVKENFKKKK